MEVNFGGDKYFFDARIFFNEILFGNQLFWRDKNLASMPMQQTGVSA